MKVRKKIWDYEERCLLFFFFNATNMSRPHTEVFISVKCCSEDIRKGIENLGPIAGLHEGFNHWEHHRYANLKERGNSANRALTNVILGRTGFQTSVCVWMCDVGD